MKQKGNRKRQSATLRKTAAKVRRGFDTTLAEELDRFIEYHPARRLSRNLRKMLMEFLTYEGATEARYLQDLLYDLQGLFEFLESIQQRQESQTKL
jgi:hypothetical protein